ncbi:candidapepsin-10 [[Candida] anglica]|uniref:candidapepsin n=1 Tax=[Candida] anglica TaxID=148631 RepID=A0ABP0EAI3_9ASCO
MKSVLVTCMALLAGLAGAENVSQKRDDKGVIKMKLDHLNRKGYLVEMRFGSNKEKASLWLETSSSDIWLPSSGVNCTSSDSDCESLGSFNWAQSSSFHDNVTAHNFSYYFDPDSIQGIWGYDNVVVGGVEVKDLTFGVAQESIYSGGVCGIGKKEKESNLLYVNETAYENLPLKMKSQGLINKAAYSIFLNSSDAIEGQLLFGGVDHAKYEGQLVTLPKASNGPFSGPFVAMDYLYFNENPSMSNKTNVTQEIPPPYRAKINVGVEWSNLPHDIFQQFAVNVNATWNDTSSLWNVPCDSASLMTVGFAFSNISIEVPLTDLIYSPVNGTCVLTVFPFYNDESMSYISLGHNFLRHVYAVFDMEDDTVSIARAKYTDEEDIVAFSGSISSNSTAIDSSDSSNPGSSSVAAHSQPAKSSSKNEGMVHGTSILGFVAILLAHLSIF